MSDDPRWMRIEPTIVSNVGWRQIVTKTFRMPDGSVHAWETINPEGAIYVAIIGLTRDNMVITAYQFRAGPERLMYEIPGGVAEANETPEQAARREFAEETGYLPGSVTPLGQVYKDAYLNGSWHYFLATGCYQPSERPGTEDALQFVQVRLLSIEDFLSAAKTGQLTDAAAVLLAHDKLRAIQEEAA